MFRTEDRWMNVLSWIHAVNLFAGFYLLVAGILKFGESESVGFWLNSLWLLLPIISSWLLIRKVKGFLIYLLAGVGTIAVTAFLSKNVLTLVFSVLIFVIRAYVRVIQGKMKNQDLPGEAKEVELWEIPTILDVPKAVHWVVYVVLYWGIILTKEHELLKWMFGLLLVEIFITYVYGSLSQMKNYVVDNCHIAHLPVKTMQRMQRAVLGITLVLLIVFVLPSVFYGKEPLTAITELKFHWEFSLEEESMEMMPEMADPSVAMEEMFGIEYKEPNPILEKILDILAYALGTIGIFIILWGVWQVCRNMMNSFEKGQEADEIISLEEGDTLVMKLQRARKMSNRNSARQKIRKTYKKVIRRSLKGNPAGWETPEELEEKAGFQEQETAKQIHEIYEKARYSQRECNDNDVEILENLKKQVKGK